MKISKHFTGCRFVRVGEKSKVPIDKNWTGKIITFEEIQRYTGNVGVLLGSLVVFDCDSPKAEELARKLPETLVVGTSYNESYRKKHFYFRLPEPMKRKVLEKDGKHIGEIQGDGQQCLIPPSIHPSGVKYEVLEANKIAKINDSELIDLIHPFVKGWTEKNLEDSAGGVEEGSRNEASFRLALHQHKIGVPKEDARKWLIGWNMSNKPPLPVREITATVDSAYSYGIKPSEFFDEKTQRFVPKRLGDRILSERHIRTIEGIGEMLVYDGARGYYIKGGEERVREMIACHLGENFSIQRSREVIEYIKTQTFTSPDSKEVGTLNLSNGVLHINTRKFVPHSPEYFHVQQIPISYDPDAKCEIWQTELSEKIPGNVLLLRQAFGYCLTKGQRYERAFLFYGPPRTMKSTVLNVLSQLLGKENVESFSLQDLNEGPFTRAYLYGKSANIYADLSPRALKETTVFMLWTGQDGITAARKHQHPFTFRPDAKLFFSCNEIPPSSNKNLAYYRRWILIHFNLQHMSVDPEMHDRLREELPGILNWALDGLDDLESKQGFDYGLTEEQTKDLYERHSDTVMSFIRNCIDTEDDSGSVTKRDVRKAYERYCEMHSLRCINHVAFGREFKELSGCGTGKRDRLPAYMGVSLLGDSLKKLKDYGGGG